MPDYFIILISIFLGAVGAFFIAHFGHTLKLTDIPNERSSHDRPTPKGGGIGILVAFSVAGIISGINPFILIAASTLSLVSFWGDFRDVSRRLRLMVQFLAAGVVIWVSGFDVGVMGFFIWVFFIAGTANFYNFMDGINGVAAITAIIASFLVFAVSGFRPDAYNMAFLSIGFACLGFLPFNVPAARVFMGDVGSILIGFWFGFMVFEKTGTGETGTFFLMISFMLPFYVDSISTIVMRLMKGENIATPHRSHVYQILANQAGIPHWKVSALYGACQLFTGLITLSVTRFIGGSASIPVVVVFASLYLLGALSIRRMLNTSVYGD